MGKAINVPEYRMWGNDTVIDEGPWEKYPYVKNDWQWRWKNDTLRGLSVQRLEQIDDRTGDVSIAGGATVASQEGRAAVSSHLEGL